MYIRRDHVSRSGGYMCERLVNICVVERLENIYLVLIVYGRGRGPVAATVPRTCATVQTAAGSYLHILWNHTYTTRVIQKKVIYKEICFYCVRVVSFAFIHGSGEYVVFALVLSCPVSLVPCSIVLCPFPSIFINVIIIYYCCDYIYNMLNYNL